MTDAELYSQGFCELIKELEALRRDAKVEVDNFRKRLDSYDALELRGRLLFANKLRTIAGRALRRPVREKREDIEDLLEDPERTAGLFETIAAAECARVFADKAGRFSIEAFRKNVLTKPQRLWLALKTTPNLSLDAENAARVWRTIVIPSLMSEYETRFKPEEAGAWSQIDRFGVACVLIAELISCTLDLEVARSPVVTEQGSRGVTLVDAKELTRLQGLKSAIDPDGRYLGMSVPILRLFEQIHLLNRYPTDPVLILGPTGAGKTELAELIHRDSKRANGKFARVSATAMLNDNEAIVREQWVGYGKGSGIQNADPKGRGGLIDDNRGGTIFVDEAHVMPRWFQVFALDLLDRQPIQRAHGTAESVSPDVRIIFASNRPLDQLRNDLNHDLLSRIGQALLCVPDLAERKEDVPLLVKAWAEKRRPTPRFLLALLNHAWPGNVRELKKAMESAVAMTREGDELRVEHLRLSEPAVVASVTALEDLVAERQAYEFLIRTVTAQGLRRGHGLQQRLAELLGVSESTVSRHIQEYLPSG